MRRSIGTSIVVAVTLAVPLLVSSPARAGLEACGDIRLEAEATCTLDASTTCEAACTPVSFQGACAAKGYAACAGQCDVPSFECNASCEANCSATCESNPDFDCAVECRGACDADCSGKCSSSENKGECEAQCHATCQGSCDASCDSSPVDCEGQCQGSCQGQCEAKANMQCQLDCQAELSATCTATMEGSCKVDCSGSEGALFCDGQYVDHEGNGQACIDALSAWAAEVNAHADGTASGSCWGGGCEGEGQAAIGCSNSVAHAPTDGTTPYAFGFLAALGALVLGRSRRRRP